MASFNSEVLHFLNDSYPELLRHATKEETHEFYFDFLLNKDLSKCEYNYEILDIPPRHSFFFTDEEPIAQKIGFMSLSSQGFINRAHKAGIAVYYWTINDGKLMKKLVNKKLTI